MKLKEKLEANFGKKITALIFCSSLILAFLTTYTIINFHYARASAQWLNVEITPKNAKLSPGQSGTWTVTIFNGTAPYQIEWRFNDSIIGNELSVTFVPFHQAGTVETLYVEVIDALGNNGFSITAIYDPATINIYLDDFPSSATYTIKTDGSGNYWAVRYDGRVLWESTLFQTTIQSAYNATTRGLIQIASGIFDIGSSPILMYKDNVWLGGEGMGATIIRKTGANPASAQYIIRVYKASGRVTDFGVVGMSFAQTGGAGANKKVFSIEGSLRGTFRDLSASYLGTFFTITDRGSATYANRRVLIENVKGYDLYGWFAFGTGANNGAIHFAEVALINQNIGLVAGTGGAYFSDTDGGIGFVYGAFQTLEQGLILISDGSSYFVERVSLEGISGNATYPASLYLSATYSTIRDNVINGNQRHGMYVSGWHNFIHDNYFKDNGQAASNTYDGIFINGANGAQIHNNVLGNNAGANRYMRRGITENSGNYNHISDNIVRLPYNTTVWILTSGGNTVSYDNQLINW